MGSVHDDGRSGKGILAILVLLVALVHLASLGNGFVWDDHEIVHREGDPGALAPLDLLGRDYFARGDGEGGRRIGYYRPLMAALFHLERRLWGRDPLGYHAVNLLMHLAVLVLAWTFLRRLFPRRLETVSLACLFFALHPLGVQSVAWIAGRTDLVAACLGLVALLRCEGEGTALPGFGRSVEVAFWLFAALLGKEMALAFVPLLALRLGERAGRRRVRDVALRLVPSLAALSVYLWLRFGVARVTSSWSAWHGGSPWGTFLVMGRVGLRYLFDLLWPFHVPVEYGEQAFLPSGPFDAGALAAWAVLALVALVVIRRARQDRLVLWGAALFAAPLLPASQLVPFYPVAAPRFLYLSTLGMALVVTVMLGDLLRERSRALRVGLALVVGLCLACETAATSMAWRDDLRLWTHAVERAPRCAMAWNQLGARQTALGGLERGLASFERSLALDRRWPAAVNLVDCLIHLHRFEAARLRLEGFRRRWPQVASFHHQAGRVAERQGRFVDALNDLRVAITLRPDLADAHGLLGVLLLRAGRLEEAELALRESLRLAPDGGDHACNLEVVRRRRGASREERRAWLRRAVEGRASPVEAGLRLARLEEEMGDPEAARRVLERCAALHGRSWRPWVRLAELLERGGDRDGAVRAWDRAAVFPAARRDALVALQDLARRAKEGARSLTLALEIEAMEPDRWRHALRTALAWDEIGRPDRALAAAERALGLCRTRGEGPEAVEGARALEEYTRRRRSASSLPSLSPSSR